jgi:hypothetical protein
MFKRNKKTFFSFIVLPLFLLNSCGSISDDYKDIETATAYYLDSAVEGIEYDCGDAPKGTTDSEGKFIFEVGEGCEFSIGDKTLRDIHPDDLSDNIRLVETNYQYAQLLQTLDNDSNPENGIKIIPDVADTLSKMDLAMDFLLPSIISDLFETNKATMVTLSTALEVVDGYNGSSVSENEAKNHIARTIEQLENKQIEYIKLR